MNVSDLLQDSPSQHRKRPSASQQPEPVSSSTTPFFAAHVPFARPDPAPAHRITSRPPPPPPPIDNAPAMASLQHPSPPPPHVHTHTPWGPPLPPRQGSSPLALPTPSSLHARQHPQQIKSLMPGPDRSPVAQRANTSGPSTPAHIPGHSPPAKQLPPGTVITPSGTLLLHKRTADEQKARLAAQAPSPISNPTPPTDHRERERQQDMDFIRQIARERGTMALPPPDLRERDRTLVVSPHDRALPSPHHDRPMSSPHDRPLPSPHDKPHDRDRETRHVNRMSPLARAPPSQAQQSPRPPGQVHQSPPGPAQRIPPPPHDRIPLPPHDRERDRIPLFPHDRDRIQPPPPHIHSHRQPPPPPPPPPLLPGQGQFQTHPPDYMGPPRDRERDIDRDVIHHDRTPAAALLAIQRLRERDARERERIPREMDQREREFMPRDIDTQREREREMAIMREREQREREREFHLQREREMGPGVPPPRTHDRDRDRERRTHPRIPSPLGLGMSVGNSAIPPLASASTGTPSSHLPPHPHDLAREREREMQMMGERDRERELAWEREREREMMDRRQYRDRHMPPINDRERDRALFERERERMAERERFLAPIDRERAMHEQRDRALYERDRMVMADRERVLVERDKMPLDRDRMVVIERDRAFMDRERVFGNEQQRDRQTFDRDHRLGAEREHRVDLLEHERERAEMVERERERRGDVGVGASSNVPGRERERGADNKMVVDVPMPDREHEREDREMLERERQREILVERERMDATNREPNDTVVDRERMDVADREREHERIDVLERGRERLEMLDRERFELLERDRLGGLDLMERERLEILERERFEILERERLEMLERERLEMLERMPNAADLAKARKEREDRPFVSLGTYVWPRTPFPYYFPEWIPPPDVAKTEVVGESTAAEAGPSTTTTTSQPPPIATELRLTVLVPSTFLPPSRPPRFRLWGGGLPPPPPFLPPSAIASSFARRRVYTDDSDVIECAVHAGLLTWSAVARAKKDGRTIKVVLSLVPTLASASGAVRGVQTNGDGISTMSMNGTGGGGSGLGVNGHVNGTTSVPRTRTNTPLPPPPPPAAPPASSVPFTSSSSSTDPASPIYAGGVWASRFIGGWGESFYGDPSTGRGEQQQQPAGGRTSSTFEEAEDDGRGCVSCGWGWGHDGSAFEVVSVEIVEKNAHVAPGLGIRNRAQRLVEYAERRADIFALPDSRPTSPSPPLSNVTNTLKRRRGRVDGGEAKKRKAAAGAAHVSLMAEEVRTMEASTICFGGTRMGVGYKYQPHVLRCALFPHHLRDDTSTIVRPPPRKRRKVTGMTDDGAVNVIDPDDGDEVGIVLESSNVQYLISRSEGEGDGARYTLSVFAAPPERECESGVSVLDADKPRSARATGDVDLEVSSPPVSKSEIGRSADAANLPPPTKTKTNEPSSSDSTHPDEGRAKADPATIATSNHPCTEAPSTPPPSFEPTKRKPSLRVIRTGLANSDFIFDERGVVVKEGTNMKGDQSSLMIVDGEEGVLKMEVQRWRWYVES